MFAQNFIKLSAAVPESSCKQSNRETKKVIDDAETILSRTVIMKTAGLTVCYCCRGCGLPNVKINKAWRSAALTHCSICQNVTMSNRSKIISTFVPHSHQQQQRTYLLLDFQFKKPFPTHCICCAISVQNLATMSWQQITSQSHFILIIFIHYIMNLS